MALFLPPSSSPGVQIAHNRQGGDPFFTNPGRSVERSCRLGINGLFFDSFSGFFASQLGNFAI